MGSKNEFTPKQLRKLGRLKRALKKEPDIKDSHFEGLPLIQSTTVEQLCKAFNMPLNEEVALFGGGVIREDCEHPFNRGITVAREYCEQLQDGVENGILYQISAWANNVYREIPFPNKALFQNASLVGMAIVINAYYLQQGPELIDKLKSAVPRDLMNAFNKVNAVVSERGFLLDRVKKVKKIPEDQMFFNNFIDRFKDHYTPGPFRDAVEDGVCAMYHVLNEVYPSLKRSSPKVK